jgi:hypothetical protein
VVAEGNRSQSMTHIWSRDVLVDCGCSARPPVEMIHNIQGYSKRNIYFQKFILQKLLSLNLCPVYRWKGNLSEI